MHVTAAGSLDRQQGCSLPLILPLYWDSSPNALQSPSRFTLLDVLPPLRPTAEDARNKNCRLISLISLLSQPPPDRVLDLRCCCSHAHELPTILDRQDERSQDRSKCSQLARRVKVSSPGSVQQEAADKTLSAIEVAFCLQNPVHTAAESLCAQLSLQRVCRNVQRSSITATLGQLRHNSAHANEQGLSPLQAWKHLQEVLHSRRRHDQRDPPPYVVLPPALLQDADAAMHELFMQLVQVAHRKCDSRIGPSIHSEDGKLRAHGVRAVRQEGFAHKHRFFGQVSIQYL